MIEEIAVGINSSARELRVVVVDEVNLHGKAILG
jgi:hypothetical protein